MNSIAIYKILNRIPDTSEAEARDAANSIAHVNDVATKTDIAELRTELKSEIVQSEANLRTELKAEIAQSETNIRAELKTEIAILKTELIKWMVVFPSIIIIAVGWLNKF